MDAKNKKRKPIKKRVLTVVLASSMLLLTINAVVHAVNMGRIWLESLVVFVQMEQSMLNRAENKAEFANAELSSYMDLGESFGLMIHDIYTNPKHYVKHSIPEFSQENEGTLTLQRLPATADTDLNSLQSEAELIANVVPVFYSAMSVESGTITSIYIATESGQILFYDRNSNIKNNEPFNYFDTEWYKKTKESDDVCYTDPYIDFYGRGVMITCAAPFYDENDEFAGVVAMDILISDLYESILRLKSHSTYEAFLIAPDGSLIIEDAENQVDLEGGNAENTEETGSEADSVESEQAHSSDLSTVIKELKGDPEQNEETITASIREISPDAELIQKILKEKKGTVLWNDETNVEGNPDSNLSNSAFMFYAYADIECTSWIYCIRTPASQVLSSWLTLEKSIFISFGMLILSMLTIGPLQYVISSRMADSVTKPILALSKDSKEISDGNFDYRATVYENDEIGDLAENFNQMAASIKQYVTDLAAVTAEKERIGAELNIAKQIQEDMLPSKFPPFPDRKEFDIFATMDPAREVGGDFYDFFLVDRNHIALVIADVSGKGISASLFMVVSKTLIKNRTLLGGKFSPAEILTDVNAQLCDGNEAMMFVTVWLGIINLTTGKGIAANAGHEHPTLRRAGGNYELVIYPHSPAMAVIEGVQFKEHEFELHPGDSLYVYTDGVAEATNAEDELFGTDRMLDSLNKNPDADPEELLKNVREGIDTFVGDSSQYDDITMLGFRWNGPREESKKSRTKKVTSEGEPEGHKTAEHKVRTTKAHTKKAETEETQPKEAEVKKAHSKKAETEESQPKEAETKKAHTKKAGTEKAQTNKTHKAKTQEEPVSKANDRKENAGANQTQETDSAV